MKLFMTLSLLASVASAERISSARDLKAKGSKAVCEFLTLEEQGSTDTIIYESGDPTAPGVGDCYLWRNNPTTMGGSIKGSCNRTQIRV